MKKHLAIRTKRAFGGVAASFAILVAVVVCSLGHIAWGEQLDEGSFLSVLEKFDSQYTDLACTGTLRCETWDRLPAPDPWQWQRLYRPRLTTQSLTVWQEQIVRHAEEGDFRLVWTPKRLRIDVFNTSSTIENPQGAVMRDPQKSDRYFADDGQKLLVLRETGEFRGAHVWERKWGNLQMVQGEFYYRQFGLDYLFQPATTIRQLPRDKYDSFGFQQEGDLVSCVWTMHSDKFVGWNLTTTLSFDTTKDCRCVRLVSDSRRISDGFPLGLVDYVVEYRQMNGLWAPVWISKATDYVSLPKERFTAVVEPRSLRVNTGAVDDRLFTLEGLGVR